MVLRDSPMTGTVVGELLTDVQSVQHGAVGLDHRRHMRLVETEPLAAPLDHGVRKRRRRASQFAQGGLIAEVEAVPPERVKESGTKPIGVSTRKHRESRHGYCRGSLDGRPRDLERCCAEQEAPNLIEFSIEGCRERTFTDLPEVATPGSWTTARHLISAADVTNRSIRLLAVRLEG